MNARTLVTLAALAACTPRTITTVNTPDDAGADATVSDVTALPEAAVGEDRKAPTDLATSEDRLMAVDVIVDDRPAPTDAPASEDAQVVVDAPAPADIPAFEDVPMVTDVPAATDAAGTCRGDRDCSGAGQVCDTTRMLCVDCVRDQDCTAPNTFCLANRCATRVVCTTSRMCPGQVCDTARMLCVDCLSPVDCAPGQRCVAGSCMAGTGACMSNTDCPGQVCNTATGACVQCLAPSDCPSGQTCRANACAPTACVPGAVSCADATSLRRCSLDGMSETVSPCLGAPGASGRCTSGVCGLACLAGFADCDGNPMNGCEVNLTSNPAHCGRCMNACAPATDGGVGACSAGRCSLVCPAGRGDCDGNAANGCETDTSNNTAHCGACGNTCGTGVSCVSGACGVMLRGLGGSTGFGPDLNCMHPNDDGSYQRAVDGGGAQPYAIPLGDAFGPGLNFYGTTFTSLYVNTNGNITFRGANATYSPMGFPSATVPMIAPWLADVDTRGGGQPMRNNICWALESGRFVVTWDRVGYYASHDTLQNSFQIVIRNRADVRAGDFDVELRYERCAWTTGDASGGMSGLGGTPAQVGFDAGDRSRFLAHPSSRTASVLDLCRTSNTGQNGVWRYLSRNGVVSAAP